MQNTSSRRKRFLLRSLVWLPVALSLVVDLSYGNHSVEIKSTILRTRVIVTDHTFLKKTLYVAFSVAGLEAGERHTIRGQLFRERQEMSAATISSFREKNGNLVFDLPYDMPDGFYTLQVEVMRPDGTLAASRTLTVPRSEFENYYEPGKRVVFPELEEQLFPDEPDELEPTSEERSRGYVVFSRSRLAYVFPQSRPRRGEVIDHLAAEAARNSVATLTVDIYALRGLGVVKARLSELRGAGGVLAKESIRGAAVGSVQGTAGLPRGKFGNFPVLLTRNHEASVADGKSQRFWFTVRIDEKTQPGVYRGRLALEPQFGEPTFLPVSVTVAPVTLEDIPGVDYCMLMTYEFTELALPWKKEDQQKLYNAALNILRDYKEHGMTTLCLHSPFVLMTNEDGSPRLDDIYAALRAARDAGFRRPIIWYMGHLIQTAKSKHPGSIIGFDENIQIPRLRTLVKAVTEYASKNGCPEVVVLPIDEPDDLWRDAQAIRDGLTAKLVKAVRESGARSMITVANYASAKGADYVASSVLKQDDVRAAHAAGARYWLYDNSVTLDCSHPAYARYRYGYYTWEHDIDGMSSWTFQNTQNAGGWPATASATGYNVYLAYPSPDGPIATIKWEAIRDGIDDHKLLYQLEKRIAALKGRKKDASRFEAFTARLRNQPANPPCIGDFSYDGDLALFEQRRSSVISMILEAEKELQ